MSNRKVIKVDEATWGANYLKRERDGKKCCLGFACAALGVPEKDLVGHCMPYDVAITKFNKAPSKKLASDTQATLLSSSTYKGPFIYGTQNKLIADCAAEANDAYHRARSPKRRAALLDILKRCFRAVNLELEIVPK